MHSSFKKDRVEIIEEAKKVGVNQFIITGTNVNSSQLAAQYASKYPETLYSTSGVHPHDAKTCNGHSMFELEKIAKDDCVVAIGECRNRVEEFANKLGIPCSNVETMKDAVPVAYKNAIEGDTILLSPASASWDQYKKFEDRGDEFKTLVNNL
jgi:hypothetical protein